MTLFELTKDMQALEAQLEESGGELTPEIEASLMETSESLSLKIDNYHTLLAKFKASSEYLAGEIKRLQALKKTADNAEKSLKEHLCFAMQSTGTACLEGNACKVSLAKSPVSTIVNEEVILEPFRDVVTKAVNALPGWVKISLSVDKTALKAEYYGKDEQPDGLTFDDTKFTIKIR